MTWPRDLIIRERFGEIFIPLTSFVKDYKDLGQWRMIGIISLSKIRDKIKLSELSMDLQHTC